MEINKLSNVKGGWFIGDFSPAVMRQKDFEVGYKVHKKGEIWPKHTHKIATEITVLIRGKMIIQGQTINAGDIFTLYPNEIAYPEFLEDCELTYSHD